MQPFTGQDSPVINNNNNNRLRPRHQLGVKSVIHIALICYRPNGRMKDRAKEYIVHE